MDEDINDKIYENIESMLKGENKDFNLNKELFMKICSNTANNEEKEEWNKSMDIDTDCSDINNKLQECFNLGYNIALDLDTNKIPNDDGFIEEFNSFKTKVYETLDNIQNSIKELNEKLK